MRGLPIVGPGAAALVAIALAAGPTAAFDWVGKVELDAEGLRDSDPHKRRQAVNDLARYDADSLALVKPHLLRALRDPDPQVRARAGEALGRHQVVEALPVVVEWLNDADPQIRLTATNILANLGDARAVRPLVRSLGDPSHEVRLHAVKALGTLGSAEVVEPLIGRLEDDKAEVRRAAADQLAELGDRRSLVPLVGAMNDSSLEVRSAAIRAVGRLGDESAVPALIRLLRDPVPQIRVDGISALGDLRAAAATDALIEALSTGSDDYRTNAAYALGKIARGGKDARAARRATRALVAGLESTRSRSAAREALLAAGSAAVPGLVDHLRGEIPGDPASAVILLRDIGDRRATPVLLAELERSRLPVELVLGALGRAGDRRALIPVLTLLSDRDPAIRLAAMEALEPMLEAGSQAADILVDLLDDPSGEVRHLAIEYLGAMRARVASERLVVLAKGAPAERTRVAALEALAEIADPRVTGDLLELLASAPAAVKRATSAALIQTANPEAAGRLLELINERRGDRALLVRTLGGVLRGRGHGEARRALLELARSGRVRVSVAALAALGAMGDKEAEAALIELAASRSIDRRRGAMTALGNLGTAASHPVLTRALADDDDGVAAAAAWSLARLGATGAVAALERATRRRGFAAPVNATAALAALADRAPPREWSRLLHHPRRLVRANAALALGRARHGKLAGELEHLLRKDPSWTVRLNAARSLSQLGAGNEALAWAAKHDGHEQVRDGAAAVLEKPFAPPIRDQWRLFYVVDPTDADALVAQEPYFLVASDGLVTATYSDANGEIAEEAFPAGDAVPRHIRSEDEI